MCLYSGELLLSLPLAKKSNVMSPTLGQPDVMCSQRDVLTNTKQHLWVFLPNVFHITITTRKPSDKSRMWDLLQDTWSVLLQKQHHEGTSLEVQRLRLCASTAGSAGSIPGRGTKVPHAAWCGQKVKKENVS